MNRYIRRLRDAWAVLTGHKVAVGPSWQPVTTSSDAHQLIPNADFQSGGNWYFGGNTFAG